MPIKAKFESGVTSIKLDAIYQWDYGRQLEIESADLLSTIVEVHFSYSGLPETIVQPCSVTNGVATVAIPNRCLEQTNAINAWIYEIEGNEGKTTKEITIPIIARARPGRSPEISNEIHDCYTDLMTEVNEALESLTNGSVVAMEAIHATTADSATTATTATRATTADKAGTADSATAATTLNRYLHHISMFETMGPLQHPQGVSFTIPGGGNVELQTLSAVANCLYLKGFYASINMLPASGTMEGKSIIGVYSTTGEYLAAVFADGESMLFQLTIPVLCDKITKL